MKRLNEIILIILTVILLLSQNSYPVDQIRADSYIKTYSNGIENMERRLMRPVLGDAEIAFSNSGIDSTMGYFLRILDSISYIEETICRSSFVLGHTYSCLYAYLYYKPYSMLPRRSGFVEDIMVNDDEFDVELNPPSMSHNYITSDSINHILRKSCK